MAADKQNVVVYEGDYASLIITITDENGAPLNLTGYSAAWILARCPGDLAIMTKTTGSGAITIQNAAAGILAVILTGSDTALVGQFWHQLVITDPTGVVSTVTTGTYTSKPRT